MDIKNVLEKIQPMYNELNSKYSKSYLSGSIWYVGEDLLKWWEQCNNIRYCRKNIEKIKVIMQILILYKNKNNNN